MTVKKIDELIAEIAPEYSKGDRDEITVGMTGWLAKEGYSEYGVEAFVRETCRRHCDEELSARLLIVRDTFRKEPRMLAGYSWLKDRIGDTPHGS